MNKALWDVLWGGNSDSLTLMLNTFPPPAHSRSFIPLTLQQLLLTVFPDVYKTKRNTALHVSKQSPGDFFRKCYMRQVLVCRIYIGSMIGYSRWINWMLESIQIRLRANVWNLFSSIAFWKSFMGLSVIQISNKDYIWWLSIFVFNYGTKDKNFFFSNK